jgi:hypothetical protein
VEKIAVDVSWGLRYYAQNIIVRFDICSSREGEGIDFKFGDKF